MPRILTALLPLLAVVAGAGCSEATGTTQLVANKSKSGASDESRICKSVEAWATGFGEKKVSDFAQRNLNIVVLDTKDEMRRQGARAFSSKDRGVSCEPYIDFGGSIGQEHECKAVVTVCGKFKR